MVYQVLAELIMVIHLGFILFVLGGAFLAFRWPRLIPLHLACVVWGVLVEWADWVCPLTPLENRLRRLAGDAPYGGGFSEAYLLPLIYPDGLTRSGQVALGVAVLFVNAMVYGWIWFRRRHPSLPS
jgi:hypothetical protein